MEIQRVILDSSCRVCGKEVFKATKCQSQILSIWGQNILVDSDNVHPKGLCANCRSICINKKYSELGNPKKTIVKFV